jgi:hypothetical protein
MRLAFLPAVLVLACGFSPEPEDVSGWSFVVSKGAAQGIETVASPTRSGATSISFALKPGSCTANDCANDRERLELKQNSYQREGETWWYGWSFYLPQDFAAIWPARLFLGQFHQEDDSPVLLFSVEPEGLRLESSLSPDDKPLLVPDSELRGRWHDVVMKVTWSSAQGQVSVAVDGKEIVNRVQPTMTAADVYFKFGIYRAHLSRAPVQPLPQQRAYFDNVRRGKSLEDVMP